MSEQYFVIVGGGLTAAKAAETLRTEGFTGAITIISAEDSLPYERPPLSKGVLAGTETDEATVVHDAAWYVDNSVELRRGVRAIEIDRDAHTLALSCDEVIPYDKLLIATGSAPRKLKLPGSKLAGVHYLRTKGNAADLKDALTGGGKNVVVVGAGWIGLETAAAARGHGNTVTVIEPQSAPLKAALGQELGTMFGDLHRKNGVTLQLDTGVTEFVGDGGTVTGVKTSDGTVVPADVVIIGIGARPMTQLAEEAGLDVDKGILVDASLRTSDEDIFAAGDVAQADHPLLGRSIRVEHWATAINQGPAAAKAMMGQQVSYDHIPYFFTDQYDLGMEFTGDLDGAYFDEITYRGDKDAGEFVVFWTSSGKVLAGMNVNVWDVSDDIAALIRSGRSVDLGKLADAGVPLAEV